MNNVNKSIKVNFYQDMSNSLRCNICGEIIDNNIFSLQDHLEQTHEIIIDDENFDKEQFQDYYYDILDYFDSIEEQ